MATTTYGTGPRWKLWGQNIARTRKMRGYSSQRAFAEAVGVHKNAVQSWEAGQIAPRDPMKVRIARALETEPAALFPLEVPR